MDPEPLSAEAFTDESIDYWRRAVRDRFVPLSRWTDEEVMLVVARFLATLDRERAAPAGLVKAARELLIVLDDTYPEGEQHPTPLVAIAALRAALSEEG